MASERPAQSTEAELERAKPFIKAMSAANVFVFRLTGGRIGAKFFKHGSPVGLLGTTGRKSGAQRTAPLIYLQDGARIVLVASQGGLPRHPVWYSNLEAQPDVSFQTREGGKRAFRARRASPDEKAALWPRLCAVYPDYADYQARTEREIPVVILEPR
jgi:deazaflavin-dependent oxidoreductase (nitroreductase family)